MEKPNLFESVTPCSGQYSFKRDLRLNAWLGVTVVVYLSTLLLLSANRDWSPVVRGLIALTPLLPTIMYLRDWIRFVHGMDELQRRVQVEAGLFASMGTVLVGVAIATLNGHGVVVAGLQHGLDFGGMFVVMFALWLVGLAIANRRYR